MIPTNGIGTDTYIMLNPLGESDEKIIKQMQIINIVYLLNGFNISLMFISI